MTKSKHFLFDLDGTLIDSIGLITASFRFTFNKHMDVLPQEAEWLATIGQPLWDQFGQFVNDRSEVDEMIATYREHNEKNHDLLLREYPGVLDAVAALAASGGKMGIVTSKLHRMAVRGLRRCGFESMFEIIVGSDDVEKHKPNPEPVLKAMSQLDIAPEDTIYIGDSPHDMRSGRAAGVRTGAVLWGPFTREELSETEPDIWFNSPADLLTLI